jgi:hypothetical protein
VRPAFERLAPDARGSFIAAFNAAARLGAAEPPRPADPLRAPGRAAGRTAYEEFIGATGCVPTRENLHDFFNGLVWQTFPLIKRELNALQAAQIAPPASASRAVRRATPPPSSTRTPPCWWCAMARPAARWSTACAPPLA